MFLFFSLLIGPFISCYGWPTARERPDGPSLKGANLLPKELSLFPTEEGTRLAQVLVLYWEIVLANQIVIIVL